ncbi:MAG: biotin--[acetyl-CoA-carboxylase] ligase [Bryobacterales bacterium]|nr:biotin--[acetyl-CoA-carboxylase] ligase [Bryobacterales bacterium]
MVIDILKLEALMPGREIHWQQETESTMNEASLLARQQAPHGAIAGAERQTQGQGRMGREWLSPEGQGLYATFILRPKVPAHDAPLLTICLGLAVAEALARVADLRTDLRWPNDILVQERKLAGILVKYEDGAFLAGIGINLEQRSFPEGLATPATSLAIEGRAGISREALLAQIATLIDSQLHMLAAGGKDRIIEMFTLVSSYARGKYVEVEFPSSVERGVTDGLNEDGYLWLRLPNGKRKLVVAGGVRPVANT